MDEISKVVRDYIIREYVQGETTGKSPRQRR